MKTVKKDVLQVEAKEELKDLKTKQSSLAEETNRLRNRLIETEMQSLDSEMRAKSNSKRLDILASTQDIFNKNQTEELKDLRRMLTEKTLDTNTEPNSTMTKQKMDYLTTEMSNFTTKLNNLAEKQDQIRSDQIQQKIEMSDRARNINSIIGWDVKRERELKELKTQQSKFDVQQTRSMDAMTAQNELTHALTRQLGAMHDQMTGQFDAMYDQFSTR